MDVGGEGRDRVEDEVLDSGLSDGVIDGAPYQDEKDGIWGLKFEE